VCSSFTDGRRTCRLLDRKSLSGRFSEAAGWVVGKVGRRQPDFQYGIGRRLAGSPGAGAWERHVAGPWHRKRFRPAPAASFPHFQHRPPVTSVQAT